MAKYSKYEFQELPKESVVNFSEIPNISDQNEDIITHAITEHLQTIIGGDDIAENAEYIIKDEEEVILDLEQVKLESYNQGVSEATTKYENIICDTNKQHDFLDLLQQKLEIIQGNTELDKEAALICMEMISNITEILCLKLPEDFEKLLHEKLFVSLKKFYKSGSITLRINPQTLDICKNVLKANELPSKLQENFEIVEDDSLNIYECELSWQNTTLKYDKDLLLTEVQTIIKQLENI